MASECLLSPELSSSRRHGWARSLGHALAADGGIESRGPPPHTSHGLPAQPFGERSYHNGLQLGTQIWTLLDGRNVLSLVGSEPPLQFLYLMGWNVSQWPSSFPRNSESKGYVKQQRRAERLGLGRGVGLWKPRL